MVPCMTDTAQLDAQARQLIEDVVAAARACMPSKVNRAVLTCNAVGVMSTFSLRSVDAGIPRKFAPGPSDRRISNAFGALRRGTRTDRGAFYVATIEFTRDGVVAVDLDYDTEPTFKRPAYPTSFTADLEATHRDPATYPDWLRVQVHEESAVAHVEAAVA